MRVPLLRALTTAACLAAPSAFPGETRERWVYVPANFQVDQRVEEVIDLMRRARPLGYTHFLIADSKFARVPELIPRYFANVEKVRAAAAETGIELVPALFGVGYSNDLLSNDPNLAEGLPVKDALLVARGGAAWHQPDPPLALKDSALENRGAWNFVDDTLASAEGALRSADPEGNARFAQRVKLTPFRQYRVSVWIKTDAFSGGRAEIKVLPGNGGSLNHTYPQVAPSQDWTGHHVTFNSLGHKEATLYFGVWAGHRGTLWWRNPRLEECAPVNVLRRPGAPFIVREEASGRELREGEDFEPYADPKLGRNPYAGEYQPWHEPAPLRVPGMPDGTRLRVSYFHPHVIHDHQVCACVSEPAFMRLLERQAADVFRLWQAKSHMMSHDEWRVLNWCQACVSRNLTPGQIAASNIRECSAILRAAAPGARQFVWSDMFDPHHNARPSYYLVNGDLAGSWEGLDPEVVIVNWNSGKAAESLRFFAGRSHRQLIAGYYDGPLDRTRRWLEEAREVPGLLGAMYTTWRGNYDDLEAYAAMLGELGW